MERFTGTCERLEAVDCATLAKWISEIPFEDWPQQARLNGELRPAMVTDLGWHGFGAWARPIVDQIMQGFPGCRSHQWMLSVVMSGHDIQEHADDQAPKWLTRIHVPLLSNEQSEFRVGGVSHVLEVGQAYRVNTLARHSVNNAGSTPRVHFMFDVDQ